MRQPAAFYCDICSQLKGVANHWFLASLLETSTTPSLVLSQWNIDVAFSPNVAHLCGEGCVQKMTQRWLTTQSLEAPRTPAGDAA